jgi:hypothetical protein
MAEQVVDMVILRKVLELLAPVDVMAELAERLEPGEEMVVAAEALQTI